MDGRDLLPDYDRNWDDTLIEGRPEYLRLSSFTYLLGWLYERLVNALPGLEQFRILLIAVLEKPA